MIKMTNEMMLITIKNDKPPPPITCGFDREP